MLFFVENNFTFSLPLKDWQTCILVKKYCFWDKYFSNNWCARGSYKTCVYCDLVLPHLPNGTLERLLQIPASQLPMRGSSPWRGNLTFRMLLWIHQQNFNIYHFLTEVFLWATCIWQSLPHHNVHWECVSQLSGCTLLKQLWLPGQSSQQSFYGQRETTQETELNVNETHEGTLYGLPFKTLHLTCN